MPAWVNITGAPKLVWRAGGAEHITPTSPRVDTCDICHRLGEDIKEIKAASKDVSKVQEKLMNI